MKKFLKIVALVALAVALPAQAALLNLNFDTMIVAQPVVLPSTSSTSDAIPTEPIQPLNNIVLQNTTLNLEPLVQLQQEFKTFDLRLMSAYELQIYNDLQKQLDFSLQPKIFTLDERVFDQSLLQYRDDRVAQIRQANAGNIAEVNDQLGVLDDEVDEFSFILRDQLVARAVLMEKEQEQLVLNLQLSLADFKTYYQFKQEEESAVRSGSLTESPTVTSMSSKLEAASDTYKEVEETQGDLLDKIAIAKTDVADDSLKSVYLTNVEMQVQSDADILNSKLDELQDQREVIVTLSDDIKLLSAPIVVSDSAPTSDDKMVVDEQEALLAAKEVELQEELNVYYQMQTETQVILTTSLASFATFQLK